MGAHTPQIYIIISITKTEFELFLWFEPNQVPYPDYTRVFFQQRRFDLI